MVWKEIWKEETRHISFLLKKINTSLNWELPSIFFWQQDSSSLTLSFCEYSNLQSQFLIQVLTRFNPVSFLKISQYHLLWNFHVRNTHTQAHIHLNLKQLTFQLCTVILFKSPLYNTDNKKEISHKSQLCAQMIFFYDMMAILWIPSVIGLS